MRAVVLVFVSFLLAACAAAPRYAPKGPPPPTVQVEIEGSSRDETRLPARVVLDGAKPTLREEESLRTVARALRVDGFPEPGALGYARAKVLTVRVKFSQDASSLGANVFGMFPPKARVLLRAMDGGEVVWEFQAAAPSAGEDIRPLLPALLAAGYGKFGRSTGGKQELALAGDDYRRLRLEGKPLAKRGLLQD